MVYAKSPQVTQPNLPALRQAISKTFSLDELQVLCFDLNIEYENLSGQNQDIKVIELIKYANRHGRLQDVITYVQKNRSNLNLEQAIQPLPILNTISDQSIYRRRLRDERRDIYLVHTLRLSPSHKGWYDILIYLVPHKEADLMSVSYAEFFLGKMWKNQVFRVENEEGFIGINISAYGPVLCTCQVVFKDNYKVTLERYIDFEMADWLSALIKPKE